MEKYTITTIISRKDNFNTEDLEKNVSYYTNEKDTMIYYHSFLADALKRSFPFAFIQIIDHNCLQIQCDYIAPGKSSSLDVVESKNYN